MEDVEEYGIIILLCMMNCYSSSNKGTMENHIHHVFLNGVIVYLFLILGWLSS